MIEWTELKPYQNDKRRSFEELCYQIAKGLYEEKGRFTSVDDSGGGDGVEFYLTLPSGAQWGWQAKFYHPQKRLSESGRKRSITNSLKKSCEIHPRLTKWILCTPTDFTLGEQTWFDNTLPQSIPENMDVELEHWGDSEFNDWLSEPRFSGKFHYFFGELELNLDWFRRQFNKQMAGVGDKFDSSLHTETNADAGIHALLGDKVFVHQITKWIEKLEEELPELKDAVNDLKGPPPNDIVWIEEGKSKVIGATESLQSTLVNTIAELKQARKFLNEEKLSEAQAMNFGFEELQKTFDSYREIVTESDILKEVEYTGEQENKEQALREAARIVYRPDSLVANLLDDLYFSSAMRRCEFINEPDIHIFGDAGTGKTHIACNICDDRLKNGLPGLFVRGSFFTNNQTLEKQLQDILDISPYFNWGDFLQALSAAAEAYHTRIPLIIDGLNESTHNGTFSKIWELGLTGLVQEITQTRNVVLITTCRTSYKEAIWRDKNLPNSVYAHGFDTNEVTQEAIEKYFNAYKIKADFTLAALRQFEHPLHLKIFCETKNCERKTEVRVYVGEQSLFEVFDEYLEQLDISVRDHFGHHKETHIVDFALSKIAAYLWKHRSRSIPLKKLVCLIDDQPFDKVTWQSSKTRAIIDEGLLLIYKDWVDDTEVVGFTHDLLGGYLIARYLVQQPANQRHGHLYSIVSNLFGKRNLHRLPSEIRKCLGTHFLTKIRIFWSSLWGHKTEHPLCDDIGRCLAALLLSVGQFLHEFSDNEKAFRLSIRALFEISPKHINEDCISLIACLFELSQCRKFLLKLAETTVGHPDHPFSAPFWSKQLSALPMPERDLSWTEHVRKNRERFENTVPYFEETCQDHQDISELSTKHLHLLAEYIMWILTSTVRPLRDKATRALYWYGRHFPQAFFDLVMKSFSIDDPYVSERMLAATYGIAMAQHNNFEDDSFLEEVLPTYGRELYETLFKPNAPHATTHILARDYARRTIDIALIHHPDLLTDDERERITLPFTEGGIRKWGESENKEEGPPPIQMDFDIYTLKGLIKYDNRKPNEHKRIKANVYWRIYDLGFSLDSFGEIDRWLAEDNYRKYGRSGDGRKTDRYGKKYSWIAYFELAGFRQDNGLLPDYYSEERTLEVDIDPSFPDEQREHNLVTEDLLGNREVPAEQWVSKTPHPDLTSYLKIDGPCGEKGTWILLNGFLSQKDDQVNRDMFSFFQGLIVKSEEVEEIVEILKKQENIDRSTLPFCPEDGYTYAGEIPWCDTYPENIWEEVSLKIGTVLVPEEQPVILRDGESVPDEELKSFWDSIVDMIEPEDPFGILLGYSGINSITNLIETRNWQMIEAQLHKRGFELTTETVDIEQPEFQTFEMLVPIRENHWSDSSSAAVPSRNVAIPIRQIAETFSLYGHPQSFDLFEKSGKRASITFCYGEEWKDKQDFTYLREDLLERYLAEIGAELIWVIWGNRRLVSENPDDPYKNFHEVKTYHEIQKASGDS